jgi:hypothetical protein
MMPTRTIAATMMRTISHVSMDSSSRERGRYALRPRDETLYGPAAYSR